MTDKLQDPTTEKEETSNEDLDTEFECDFQLQEYDHDHEQDLDLEEDYLSRLKIQRKRIEELSQLHQDNEDRLKRQIDKNRYLQEEINRLSTAKEFQAKYSEISNDLQTVTQENKLIKDQLAGAREELYQSNNQKLQAIQKLKYELSLLKNKESTRIEQLEEELANKQDDYEALQREYRNKEKDLQDTISSLKNKIDTLIQENDHYLRSEQRKSQKLERDLQTRSSCLSDFQNTNDALQKENSQLKEEVFRLGSLLASREQEIKGQAEKFKYKLASLKKEAKNKEKECSQLKDCLKKQERDAKESNSESQSLRIEIKKLIESQEMERHRHEIDTNKEKQSLQIAINQHLATIEELIGVKNDLLAENKKLMTILRKKEVLQKQRKALLRTQLKEIDKLQKVIDKIVE